MANEELSRGGYLPGDQGAVLLLGPAADLFEAWRRFLTRRLEPFHEERLEAPAFLDRHVLEASKYATHFPHQLFAAREHRRSRSRTRYLAPAACLHLYGVLEDTVLPDNHFAVFVVGACARAEQGQAAYPYRLNVFHMAELVVLGEHQVVEEKALAVETVLAECFRSLSIDGDFRPATDSFFLPASRGARVMQQLKGLKREFASRLETDRVALASLNRHQDHFARLFRIRLAGGRAAHSFCAAFGLERLTAAGLLRWGRDPAGWPAELSA